MKLFQYEQKDKIVSIVAAEDKEEACDLLIEIIEEEINPDRLIPLRNFLLSLAPNIKQKNVSWNVDDIGAATLFELPMLEQLKKEEINCDVIQLCEFLNRE